MAAESEENNFSDLSLVFSYFVIKSMIYSKSWNNF